MDRKPLTLLREVSTIDDTFFFSYRILSIDARTLARCLFRDFLFLFPGLKVSEKRFVMIRLVTNFGTQDVPHYRTNLALPVVAAAKEQKRKKKTPQLSSDISGERVIISPWVRSPAQLQQGNI